MANSNHIDLTLDDDDDDLRAPIHCPSPRLAKRPRTEHQPASISSPSPFSQRSSIPTPSVFAPSPSISPLAQYPHFSTSQQPLAYRPPFAGQYIQHPQQKPHPTASPPSRSPSVSSSSFQPSSIPQQSDRQIIDLTGSPSPPPPIQNNVLGFGGMPSLPAELPPKTPVCIGQLTVTALILYPVGYLLPQNPGETEWAYVRLQYEHNPNKVAGKETIHIRTPHGRGPNGETLNGEGFGVIEQKSADSLGPMLGKGLIRLDAKIRKGSANLPILPMQMLVYTPKGNIPVVGNYLKSRNLLLDHPSPPYDVQRLSHYHYFNPHHPPPGGYNKPNSINRIANSHWSAPVISGKSVEVQRNQVEELFKELKDGDDLKETEPAPEVATNLYPHQKKALTFLLERERERSNSQGEFSSLWTKRNNPFSGHTSWLHMITEKEIWEQPREAKGAILADDMGLGKTITCVSLIAGTLSSSAQFASTPFELPPPPPPRPEAPDSSHFAGSVWGMPENAEASIPSSAKGKAKADKVQDKIEADYARSCRIKVKSRATLIICPLSTVANWEDQFREHWKGEVSVIGGSGGVCPAPPSMTSSSQNINFTMQVDEKPEEEKPQPKRVREGTPLRVYIYHGNARRPDPTFLADFDAVITTYATLASEFSKQTKSLMAADDDDEEDASSEGVGGVDIDEHGNQTLRLPKPKKAGLKRKKTMMSCTEIPSALQSIHWFRVVLDEAHSIKETGTVASRACCDLMADRRLCLTGTPVQNKLDDVFALIKFLRLEPFDDKNVWTEYIGSPVKFGQKLGVARLQMIMQCITLRRTKETRAHDGKKILSLPPRRDELRTLKFDSHEQEIYDHFFNQSKEEFKDLSNKNEIMKNYVGILQKILRLRQICDHFDLVKGKEFGGENAGQDGIPSYEEIASAIAKEGLTHGRALAIFAILRESATTQCVECGGDLCVNDTTPDTVDEGSSSQGSNKRSRRPKASGSRVATRQSSPNTPRPVLTRCQHLFCIECYRNCICPGWPNVNADVVRACSACQTALSPSDVIEIKTDGSMDAPLSKKRPPKREKRQKGTILQDFHPSTKIKALLNDLVLFSKLNAYSLNYDPEVVVPDEYLKDLDGGTIKTVVFSQWTSMLDKVEDALETANIKYDRLDGTMKRDDRTRAMEALKHDPACEVLLVSLKAGGVGLNLTAAQRVYLLDPYWNPAVENQAVDRIHRLGQTRPVTTVKLIIENSIEARLLEVQRKKTELANMTLGQTYTKADLINRRIQELEQLFGGS